METTYEINGATGEVVVRKLTSQEQVVRNNLQSKMLARSQAQDVVAAAKASARAKLKALGLTDEEIAALVGG